MGLELSGSVPSEVDVPKPMPDLHWKGAHAAAELAKLLDYTQAALVITSQGGCRIVMKGTGGRPAVPAARLLASAKMPGLGRRGKTVIFTSAPFAVIETVTLEGPDPETWDFVGKDTDGTWKPLDGLFSGGAIVWMTLNYRGWWDPATHPHVIDAFHYIRLSKDWKHPRLSSVLRQQVGSDGKWKDIEVSARIAVRKYPNWENATDFVRVPASYMLEDPATGQTILRADSRLVRVYEPTTDLWTQIKGLAKGDLKVRFSFEASTEDGKQELFAVGFRQSAAGVEKMSPGEVQNALASGGDDVVAMPRPELRLRRVDGVEVNRQELEEKAKAMAGQYLAGSESDCEILVASGFLPVELDGLTTEIAWDQETVTTSIRVNSWHYPLTAVRDKEVLREWLSQAFPEQARTEGERVAMGGTGARQPVVPISPGVSSTPASTGLLFIRITGAAQDGANQRWNYTAQEVSSSTGAYGSWSVVSGGWSGAARNGVEEPNGASGLFGNGVNSANLSGTFALQRVPNGVVVLARLVGSVAWFDLANGVDGGCS